MGTQTKIARRLNRGIFGRISDILSANSNDSTERFEDPEKMLKQAFREMEGDVAAELAELKQRLRK